MASAETKLKPLPVTGPVPDPYTKPQDYLLAKGWKCLGDPAWPTAGWLDPVAPIRDFWTDEPVYFWDVAEKGRDARGVPIHEVVKKQVMAQDGSGVPGRTIPVFQRCHHAKAEPMLLQQALMIQMGRDFKEQEAQEK